jgi:hypothetical protein
MKKTNEINSELSIEEKRKKLLEAIEKQSSPEKKKDILLMPFINEIKLMLEKKMSINSQLKALNAAGIKISYKTYKNFLDELGRVSNPDDLGTGFDAPAGTVTKGDKSALIILNDKGAVKTYAVKDEIKKLGFTWDKDKKGWKKDVNEEELEKVKNLKIGYDII